MLPKYAAGAGAWEEGEGFLCQRRGGRSLSDSKRRGGEGPELGRACWNQWQRIPFWHRAGGKQRHWFKYSQRPLTSSGERPNGDKKLWRKKKKKTPAQKIKQVRKCSTDKKASTFYIHPSYIPEALTLENACPEDTRVLGMISTSQFFLPARFPVTGVPCLLRTLAICRLQAGTGIHRGELELLRLNPSAVSHIHARTDHSLQGQPQPQRNQERSPWAWYSIYRKATHPEPREMKNVLGKRKFQKKCNTDLESSTFLFTLDFLFEVWGLGEPNEY